MANKQTETITLLLRAVDLIGHLMEMADPAEPNTVIHRWEIIYGYSSDSIVIPEKLKMGGSELGAMGGNIERGNWMSLVKQGGLFYFSYYNIDKNIKSGNVRGDYLDNYNSTEIIAVRPTFHSRQDFAFTFEGGEEIRFNQLDENRYGGEDEKIKEWAIEYQSGEDDENFIPEEFRMTQEQITNAEMRVSRIGTMILVKKGASYFVIYDNKEHGNVKSDDIEYDAIEEYIISGKIKVKVDVFNGHSFHFTLENHKKIKFVGYTSIFRYPFQV